MKAAIFDMDGTLLDSMWVWEDLADEYLLSIGVEPPFDLREHLKPLSLLDGCYYVKENLSVDKTPEEMNKDMEEILEKYYRERFQLKPYVKETLELLKNKGIRMCVATATDDRLVEMALGRIGIMDYFEFIQTSNSCGIGKKDPKFFQIAIDKLNLAPNDIFVFEDAVHCVISAKNCGLNVVAIADESAKDDVEEIKKYADLYINDFSELDLEKLK
ncbi:HAD family phosphatase [Tissierella sp. Yu-01]|uniref:HAD family hydrolase n=1 Tax=Tissierella sp. Yu-01 TaxID=3035694 RepID=UPI00240E2E0E|nr:HAD family phosphatase [Tissierella sp. Yu-01]WFA09092.1 HAD family phosphatase [Tissierella sp. Yu-01]